MRSSEGSVALSTSSVSLAGPSSLPLEHRFSPYQMNGGSVLPLFLVFALSVCVCVIMWCAGAFTRVPSYDVLFLFLQHIAGHRRLQLLCRRHGHTAV